MSSPNSTPVAISQHANVGSTEVVKFQGTFTAAQNQGPVVPGMTRSGIQLNTLEAIKKNKPRPLNSWLAFRSYLATIFVDFKQREISAFLTTFWQRDPNHAEWAVIASAYTIIRDMINDKKLTPLDKFLDLVCPQMGLVDAEDYMEEYGWELVYMGDGECAVMLEEEMEPEPEPETQTHHTFPVNTGNGTAVFQHAPIMPRLLSHYELAEFAIQHGYMPKRAEAAAALRKAKALRFATSIPTMTLTDGRDAFDKAMKEDAASVGALILGIDLDHPLFRAINDPNVLPVTDSVHATRIQAYEESLVARARPVTVPVGPIPKMSEYQWTGQMTELFKTTESEINLDSAIDPESNIVTDIGNPAVFDSFLAHQGHAEHFLRPDLPDDPLLGYDFSDSF